ncbi:MAG: hypothetical protein V1722_01475 [Candidatus Micrarchaeota archaeon]
MNNPGEALVAILKGPLARTFRVKVKAGSQIEVRLHNRTPEHLAALHEAFAQFGPSRKGNKGKRIIETRHFTAWLVPEISQEHLPPDVFIKLKTGTKGIISRVKE